MNKHDMAIYEFSKISKWLLIFLAIVFSLCVCVGLAYGEYVKTNNSFVHGRFGKYCYKVGEAHKNIKEFVYFDSYDACLADIQK